MLALNDEADELRRQPLCLGVPGLAAFLVLYTFVLRVADLGWLVSLVSTFLIASPALVLVLRDLKLLRRIRSIERAIRSLEQGESASDQISS